MAKQIAPLVFALGIGVLFALARDRSARTSRALWIPVAWFLIAGSRNVAQWLQLSVPTDADRYLEGNPVDRNVLSGLLALGIMVLVRRRHHVAAVVRANAFIFLYFAYCAASVLWSDHPDVALRRWTRALGDLVMVLVVVTDLDRLTALKRLLTRAGFLLVPLSILLIRYYPELGRTYSQWTGSPSWTGVTTEKNSLGILSLIVGLTSAWQLLQAAKTRKALPVMAHGALVAMTLHLLWEANSATSFTCFFVAGGVMMLTSRPALARRPALVHIVVAVALLVPIAVLLTGSEMVGYVGRDSTLTGRTEIWRLTIAMTTNRWLGTGFESFWLGDRLDQMWGLYYNHPNQAHNGYLEVFLNLGWLGVVILAGIFVSGYREIATLIRRQAEEGSLKLAYLVTAAVYNVTEAGFKMMHPAWIAFLLATTMVPETASPTARDQHTDGFQRLLHVMPPADQHLVASSRLGNERRLSAAARHVRSIGRR